MRPPLLLRLPIGLALELDPRDERLHAILAVAVALLLLVAHGEDRADQATQPGEESPEGSDLFGAEFLDALKGEHVMTRCAASPQRACRARRCRPRRRRRPRRRSSR